MTGRIRGGLAVTVLLILAHAAAPAERELQMVDLNVVALDAHGQPVTDLTRDDFRVTDNGKPQEIAFFHHRDSSLAVPTLGPHEYSNRGGANVPRATVILFDLLNERFSTRGFTVNQLIHTLEPMESADYVYLYCISLDGRLVPVHGLPGPEDHPAPAGGPPWTRQIKQLMDGAMHALQTVRPIEDLDPTYRVQLTYNALSAVAREMARVPGRKCLVWVTDGIPIELGPNRSDTGDFVDFTPMLRSLSEAFDRSGVAIYPVRQVMLGSPDSMGPPGTTGIGSIYTLDQFAQLTGGRPDGGKDIGSALRQAMTDMRTSYQVGYYPAASNWDNKLHKLRVTCTRKGVRIQAKTNYYAWEEPPGERSARAIESAITTTFDAAEIGLRGNLTRNASGGKAHLDAHIDAHDIVLVHQGAAYDGELRIGVVAYGQGEPRRGPLVPMNVHFSPQDYDKAMQQGIPISDDFTLPQGVEKIRVIVFDRGSEAIGSVTLPAPPN